jgi:prepilin peptidase CpaA
MLAMQTILTNWPLAFVCAAMIVAAVIDGWKLKVPNWLTFPLILSGWALAIVHTCGWLGGTGEGWIGGSLAATALGFVLLFPVHMIGGMGAGDVKMQMGFGAWIGAFYPFWDALGIVWWAFCLAVIIGGVLALIMILIRGQYRQNVANTRAILGDLFTAGSVGETSKRAAARKPRMHLLPYGIPLCLGFISFLIIKNGFWNI